MTSADSKTPPMLRLYDTLTRDKRDFVPIDPANVRMYVCGPTVYDFAHIGNARPVIVFDVLYRLLRHIYGADHVTYVRNITDVDDKINDRALRDFPGLPLNEAIRKVTETTANQFQADVAALGCLPPTHQPRATEFVLPRDDGKTDMVTMIAQLIARGHAYEAEGEVLFDTQSMPDYGALSGRKLEDQQAGARVAVDAHKKHPTDFVLWKQSSADEPGWDSPWGRGRPGWHIECSAMSAAYLGGPDGSAPFDIHGGGLDLIFPHHENEIAQSRCAHGSHAMANYWMHNGFLQVEGEKMSKSTGNFVTIRDLLVGTTDLPWAGDAIRLSMLMTQYGQPINWTQEKLAMAAAAHHRFLNIAKTALGVDGIKNISDIPGIANLNPSAGLLDSLADDLNTPAAFTHLFSLAKAADASSAKREEFALQLFADCQLLGIDPFRFKRDTDRAYLAHQMIDVSNVDSLITERTAARARKDFAESDRIRDELAAMGVVIKDSKDGTTWEIAR